MPPEDNPADEVQPTREEHIAAMIEQYQADPNNHNAACFLAQEYIAQVTTRSGVDGKYGVVTVEKGRLHPGEPVFLLRAADKVAVSAVEDYATRCGDWNCNTLFVSSVNEAVQKMWNWQHDNPKLVKLPD